ncbi:MULTISPECIES: PA3371 family protein [Pseudomonas]|uniref:PA3371 family protein n=1 Tax=Pseudomonas TaxID=286 RepID=UPI0001E9713A|nr:PA3371 family protein [Pseudomonas sp. FP597]EFQ61771.1 hypothetical protein PFWH6_4522 [Pseudomonas fluorescens WH6]WLI05357.1 hypothetical protein PSH66_22545 [Pseudomonas sp. FP597]
MSKSAWLFLCLTAATCVLALISDSPDAQTSAFVASGVCACVLLMTLVVGRRIKFDPVLR